MRAILGAAALALIATACTAIVAGELKKYDDYKVSDSAFPGDNTDPCVLTDDAGNDCSRCIATYCKDDIAYACPADGGTPKPWFPSLKNCAQNPAAGFSGVYEDWGCDMYNDPDAHPYPPGDDTAKAQHALLCVRDNCVATAKPPCHVCAVAVRKPGQAGEYAQLEDSVCGRCMRDNCGDQLVQCCEHLPADLPQCAYHDNGDYDAKCHALLVADAGGPDANPPTGDPLCAWKLAKNCFPLCASQCP